MLYFALLYYDDGGSEVIQNALQLESNSGREHMSGVLYPLRYSEVSSLSDLTVTFTPVGVLLVYLG